MWRKRLWREKLPLKHWREFSPGYHSSCASSSAAVEITWQTQTISVLTEHPALLVPCHFQPEEQSLPLFTGGTQLLLQQFPEPLVRHSGRLGKGNSRKGALKFVLDEAGFAELSLRGLGGRKQCLNLCVSWSLRAVLACTTCGSVPVPPGSIWAAGTPDARLTWNELYFKAFPFPTGQGFSIGGLCPGGCAAVRAGLQTFNLMVSPPQLWGTSGYRGTGYSPVIVAFSHRLVSLFG